MAVLVGADGFGANWLVLSFDTATGTLSATLSSTAGLAGVRFDVLAIDIPIGLPEAGSREAEPLARAMLRPNRMSSVFPPPIRPALGSLTHEEASATTFAIDGRRVSVQGFSLFAKIREVRELITHNPRLAPRVFEVHPEVSFSAWLGRPMSNYKGTPAGKRERQQLIDAHFGSGVFATVAGASTARLPDVDLADAFAALWSAVRIAQGVAVSLPEQRMLDSDGFPMNIWY